MDTYRGFEDDPGLAAAAEDEAALEAPPEIGTDERRMHVRAYNYWVSLLDGRAYPSIRDLDPASLSDFGPNSVLLDFSEGIDDPAITFVGPALQYECGLDGDIGRISQVPGRSLLSRLTDHYLQIIANRAPIGFEAEFVNGRGRNTMYRGILMPFTAEGDEIDFIYGVINWKELADSDTAAVLAAQVDRAIAAAPKLGDCRGWADGPNADLSEIEAPGVPAPAEAARDTETLSLWPDEGSADAEADAPRALPDDAALADRLCLARETAEAARAADHRSRAALYRALGFAWDFARAAEALPEDYAEILEDAGLKAQARAPMTPVVKLVFGADYDKTRLTEFAAALSWAKRQDVPLGALAARIEAHDGGLKGVVQAERAARRPAPRPGRAEEIRDRLRAKPAFASVEIEAGSEAGGDEEFVLLVARREGAHRLAIVAAVADPKVTEQALRKSA
ncbi:MAG: hypothetical protein ACK4K7_04200 [Allosphingosinicella sp.]|uniref:PAS domain-containing protein n=1 Tax=Allosphingosinicella sp. TaxID=2823234 RepID=UPI00392A2D25